jgi:HD-GYP domain-containing protein (c-di-GMP phosphodiesterase class II)
MLKKIATDQLCLGMFVQELVGSWLDHPFWKSAFLIDEARQIQELRQSKVKHVWIDTAKGCDLPSAPEDGHVEAPPPQEPPAAPARAALPAHVPLPATCSLSEEVTRAGEIVAQARGAMDSMFQAVRLGKAIDTEHCLPLVNDITLSIARNPSAIVSLARLKTSDDYTYMHSVAVCALMVSLARQLKLNEADTREAGLAGLVHDLGKALMPMEVLNKPGALTHEEFAIMRGHPEAGYRLLQEGKGVGNVAMDVCLHHHEKVNGRGYPHSLKGDGISLFARMGAVCDVYDAITSNRPYKLGWDPADSVQKMAHWTREGHFDDRMFQAFVKSIGIYPTGSLVRLQSNRLGVIVDQCAESLLTPLVRAFYRADTRELCEPELLDLSHAHCQDRIVSRESAEQWGLTQLDHYWRSPS